MRKLIVLLSAAAVFCGCVCEKTCGKPVAEHVVLIGVDGCGARWIPWDAMPNLKAMRDDGLYTVGRCHRPTASAINWKSVFSGVSPEVHGFSKWNSAKPEIEPPSCAFDATGRMPCIFSEIRRQMPDAYTASVYTWDGVGHCHGTNTASYVRWYGGNGEEYKARDAAVFEDGARLLAKSPKLMFLYQGQVDSAGHKHGWGSREFTNACASVDASLGKFMAQLRKSAMWSETAIVFVADHGGVEKRHGGADDVRVFDVPFLVCGPAVKGLRLREPAMLEDVSPTIAALIGCEMPESWRGRPAITR